MCAQKLTHNVKFWPHPWPGASGLSLCLVSALRFLSEPQNSMSCNYKIQLNYADVKKLCSILFTMHLTHFICLKEQETHQEMR